MPFTFSHPAAILPLTYLPKRWVSVTGLVIGSIAPDFEYFLRMRLYSVYSHKWIGLLWFDLPLTIIFAFIFHIIVRDRLIDNLPKWLAEKFYIYKEFDWTTYFQKNILIFLLSGAVGTATHILWDGFTHEAGQFVQATYELNDPVTLWGLKIHIYKTSLYLSSIAGGAAIIYFVMKLPSQKLQLVQKSIFPFWLSVGLIALIVVSVRLLIGKDDNLSGNIAAILISAGLIGLVLTPILFPARFK